MRKSIDGLILIVCLIDDHPVIDVGSTFIFLNRLKDKIKILIRENNGFILLYKRLDKGCFKMSFENSSETSKLQMKVTQQQLRWLLDGLDYERLTPSSKTPVKHYF